MSLNIAFDSEIQVRFEAITFTHFFGINVLKNTEFEKSPDKIIKPKDHKCKQ